MLLRREDLRRRLIRLIGKGHISASTHAMEDAGARVFRYLLMPLVVNVCYGIPVAIGLYFIGVPNAVLWGAFAAVLRFIPYIGPWIGAALPIALSLAVSPSWTWPSSKEQRRHQRKNYPHRARLHILAPLRRALEREWVLSSSRGAGNDRFLRASLQNIG